MDLPPPESPNPGPELIGRTLAGRYRIESMLGEGAMGSVYLGVHVRIGRKAAVKVLRSNLARDPEANARFTRGATNASRVQHPNVCSIYDFGETEDGRAFLAMELIEGESLQEVLAREGSLPLADCIDIVRQVADALQAAHDAGIVHRDLKPGNIMLTTGRGGRRVVKVVDFDIAKGSTEGEASDLTQLGLVIGTPEYMSPEQMTADKLDGRSDVYSLAMVLFRMLAGVLPFSARTTREVMLQRLTAKPGTLAAAVPDTTFPEGLQAVLDRGLARDPELRFEDAEAFARALEPFDPARRTGTHRPSSDASRPPGATAAIGSAHRTEPAPTTGGSRTADRASQRDQRGHRHGAEEGGATGMPPTQVTKPQSRSPLLVMVPVVLIVLGLGVIWALTRGGAVPATELAVTPENATIARGETVQLAVPAELELSGGAVDWSSSDLAVASVDDSGLVTGVAPGTASITAAAGDRSVAATVSVSSATESDASSAMDPDAPSPPRLVLEASTVAFESVDGAAAPGSRSLSVAGTGVSTLQSRIRYEPGQPTDWLDAGLSDREPPATLTISVRPDALGAGSYSATVEVSSAEGVSGPVRVTYDKRAAEAADGAGADEALPDPRAWAVADTFALLDGINDRVGGGLSGGGLVAAGDTARMIWETDGARPAVSAAAAFTLAQVELSAGDSRAALEWAERAVELAPENDGYRRLRDALRGGRR